MMEKIKAGEITGQTGDYMLRATAANGQIRAFAATSRDLVEKARQAHNTSPVATAALGRLMTAGVMMGSMMKADSDLLTIRVEGDGPIGGLTVTADKNGNVKGYAFHPEVMLPPNAKGKLDVGGALGVGVLSVIQDIGLKEPYVGQTILVTGEIAEDLTYYYATSEQTPSSVALGVLMNKENTVRQAGGFIIQLLPGAEEATIAALEKTIGELEPVTTMLNKGMTPEDILELILGQFFQLIHTKFIVLVAELAVDFDALALVDHLLQLLAADADQRLFYTALGAVAGKLNRHLIQNLQTKLS